MKLCFHPCLFAINADLGDGFHDFFSLDIKQGKFLDTNFICHFEPLVQFCDFFSIGNCQTHLSFQSDVHTLVQSFVMIFLKFWTVSVELALLCGPFVPTNMVYFCFFSLSFFPYHSC